MKAAAEERLRMSLYKSPGQVPSYRSVHVIAHSGAQGVINTKYERMRALAAPKEDRAAVCQWYHALHKLRKMNIASGSASVCRAIRCLTAPDQQQIP